MSAFGGAVRWTDEDVDRLRDVWRARGIGFVLANLDEVSLVDPPAFRRRDKTEFGNPRWRIWLYTQLFRLRDRVAARKEAKDGES
jgi:hypothetical protein